MNIKLLNKFEEVYMLRLELNGWFSLDNKLKHPSKKFIIDLEHYPLVRLVEDGKKDKVFHGLSGAIMTIQDEND
jgi:hypothetical protein